MKNIIELSPELHEKDLKYFLSVNYIIFFDIFPCTVILNELEMGGR